jgi:hypothetical protein
VEEDCSSSGKCLIKIKKKVVDVVEEEIEEI